ncbi:uncharacterized protein [Atheta coriaria]|uniref:uncharacterized protein isoform X1 n=1 Tax=Dalotia coriaria TaxID=877792 RepID=UPI0031F3847F
MRYIARVLTVAPQATKIRTSEEELMNEWKSKLAIQQTKAYEITQRIITNIRIFLLGKSSNYVKPNISAKDCFFIVCHLQINIRFLVYYIDLTLEWGGFLVWIVFTAMNILICSGLAFMYTFFGDYTSRTFLSVWDMNPFFQGISTCMIFWEMCKLIETGLILASGLMSLRLFFELDWENTIVSYKPQICNTTDKFGYKPGWAVPVGISEKFTLMGYNLVSNSYSNWSYDPERGQLMGLIWFAVIFIRIFQYQRYRIFPLRVVFVLLKVMLLILVVYVVIMHRDPAIAVVYSNAYTNLFAYLQIFAFSISDYLPSHWVTIGYLHPNISQSRLIWRISFYKIFTGFMIYYAIPYFLAPFREYVRIEEDNCLNFFGIHFVFIVIPIAIARMPVKYLSILIYAGYILLTLFEGVCYLLINMEMILMASHMKSVLVYRFRNLIFIVSSLFVYSLSQLLSVNCMHYVLHYINFLSNYYTSGILLILTMLGIAIYGLERINADHHFFFGCAYNHLKSTKLLVVVCTCLSAVYILETAIFHVDRDAVDGIYWTILGICLLPFTFGVVVTLCHKKSYHGFFHPLTTWGRPQELVRTARRRKDLRRMFIYRTKRVCDHNCLLNHPILMRDVKKEIKLRQEVLQEQLDMQNGLLNISREQSMQSY